MKNKNKTGRKKQRKNRFSRVLSRRRGGGTVETGNVEVA